MTMISTHTVDQSVSVVTLVTSQQQILAAAYGLIGAAGVAEMPTTSALLAPHARRLGLIFRTHVCDSILQIACFCNSSGSIKHERAWGIEESLEQFQCLMRQPRDFIGVQDLVLPKPSCPSKIVGTVLD